MRRWAFIPVIGGAAVGWPLVLRAQQPAVPVVCFLATRSPEESATHTGAFLRGLREAGYVDGQTVAIEYRWVTAAQALKRQLLVRRASTEAEIEMNVTMLLQEGASALVVHNDPFFDTRRDRLVAQAARHGIPAIYHIREFPAAGGLMSYGPSLENGYHELGVQTARVLKGGKPSDLPVVRPTRFELAINLKTAKSLGLDVPASLLARADEVIE